MIHQKGADLNGHFVAESFDFLRFMMNELKEKRPFGWIRWGDGEMMSAAKDSPYGRRLKDALLFLSRHNQSVVNVGMHWLRQERLAKMWNQIVPEHGDHLFHEFFYLPIGDPIAKETQEWREAGILGWHVAKNEASYKVILVGPNQLRGLPFLNETAYVSSAGIEHDIDRTDAIIHQCIEIMKQYEPEPLLFLIAGGRSAKIIVADLVNRTDNIHTFVDIGSCLDGFAGIHSRDYNNPKKYCQMIEQKEPDNLHFWMKPGVCERFA